MLRLALRCAPYTAEEIAILSQAYDLWKSISSCLEDRMVAADDTNKEIVLGLAQRGAMVGKIRDGRAYYSNDGALDDLIEFIRAVAESIEQRLWSV